MKCFLLSYVALSIGIVTSTDPKDVCDTCVLKEECQFFGNMSSDEQKTWTEKYPCNNPDQYRLGSPPGFSVGAKGDYVCCSSKIWGTTSPTEQSPSEQSQKLTQNRFGHAYYEDDDFDNYNRPNYYSNAPGPNTGNFRSNNQYPNNNYSPNDGNYWGPNNNSNNGNNRGSDSRRWSPNGGKRYWNDRPNRNQWWNSRNQNNRPGNGNNGNPSYRMDSPGIPGREDFNYQSGRPQNNFNNNQQSNPPFTNGNNNNNEGNSFRKFGQCDRVTSLPPDPQSGCCGREASDDDRITEPNAPTDIGYSPVSTGNLPIGFDNSQINSGTPSGTINFPDTPQNRPPNGINNAPRDSSFSPNNNGNIPVNTGYLPNIPSPIDNGYPFNNDAPNDYDFAPGDAQNFGNAPQYYPDGQAPYNNFEFPDDNFNGPLWMLKDKAERRKRDDAAVNETVEVKVENRISGGKETELYQFPWTVLLITVFDYGNKQAAFNCGGSLISSKFVLTAGHCVFDKDGVITNVEVYLAEYDKRTFPRDCKITAQGRKCVDNVVMYAENVILHPQFDDDGLLNDIALIKLRGNAPYTDYIRPICLTSINIDEPEYSNLRLTVAGWGRDGPYRTDIKQSTVVNLVPQNECKRYYPALSTKHLCAAGHKGEDTCKGDSGGPLMTLYRGKYYVVGVVSGKRSDSPCGTSVPSLYTNVYHYLDWIRNNVRN